MGLREVILACVALLAGYIVYALFCLVRPSRPKRTAAKAPDNESGVVLRGTTAPATPPPREEYFRLQFELQQLRAELGARDEAIEALRGQMRELRDDMSGLQHRVDAAQSAPPVSPQYGEAMLLARRGLDADTIAERCGISVGEAELVRSLTQRGGGA